MPRVSCDTSTRRPRKLLKGVTGTDTLKQCLDTLALDVGRAYDSWALFNKLLWARQRQYTEAFTQSQTFWAVVLGGLRDGALGRLCRIYDQTNRDDVLTFRTLLELLLTRPVFLPSGAQQIAPRRLRMDIDSVSKERSQPVKHLWLWRNKFVAHQNTGRLLHDRTLTSDLPLTHQDIDTLLRRGSRIVNRYGMALFRNSYPMKRGLLGEDDYVEVLRTLRQEARRVE